jgi:Domain of unknown function (DUF4926)
MKELDIVVLKKHLAENGLKRGDVGTVVHVYELQRAFEVEFMTGKGSTVAVVTLSDNDVRPIGGRDMLHVRDIAA